MEDATLTLKWRAPDAERRGFLARFPHPFARIYDHTMLYLSLSLGLSGPRVRMIPIGGLILRRHVGALEAPHPPSAVPDDQPELTQLRALLAYVTSADVPGREANGESC